MGFSMTDKKILVAGTGLAGCLTALRLVDAGYNVDVIEKMNFPGGISVISGGSFRFSTDWQQTFEYLKHTNGGTAPEDILEDIARRMEHIPEYFSSLCKRAGSNPIFVYMDQALEEKNHWDSQHYGFPGWESLSSGYARFDDSSVQKLYPNVCNTGHTPYGLYTYHTVYKCLTEKISVKFNHKLERLLYKNNKVVGAFINGKECYYDAVILATGGFENNADMQSHYWQGKPVLPSGFFGNTGDGHQAASAIGADSWHMWHYHGTYGFRMPEGYGARIKGANVWIPNLPESANSLRPLHHILVDQQGQRFMNEYPPYITDTGHRALELYSAERVKYDRIPCYFISDETGRLSGPWGSVRINDPTIEHAWSNDNLNEIDQGIIKKFETLQQTAEYIGCSYNTLQKTINLYNSYCDNKNDEDFARPRSSLNRIDTAPYYVAEIYPVVGNTQGGPVHNKHRQVLNSFSEIIPGLYTAGECGSVFGHLYMSSGNLTECFTSSEAIVDHLLFGKK